MNCDPSSLGSAATCFQCIPPGMQSGVRSYLLCQWANTPTGPFQCADVDVQNWLARIDAGGAPAPSEATQRAVCDFVTTLKVNGIWNKFIAINPVIPDSLAAMVYPLKYNPANGFSPWINLNFVPADLDNNGILGDGATKYMRTGLNIATAFNATQSSCYAVVETAPALGVIAEEEIGAQDTKVLGAGFTLATYDPNAFTTYGACYDFNLTDGLGFGDISAFWCISRLNNVTAELWLGDTTTPPWPFPGLLQLSNSDYVTDETGVILPSYTALFMAINENLAPAPSPGPISFSSKRVAFSAISTGLDQSGLGEVQVLFEAVQFLRLGLGGGTV